MSIAVLGAGAFGTSLAIALSRGGAPVTLWTRDPDVAAKMQAERRSGPRLPGHDLPESLLATGEADAFSCEILLVAVPMQTLTTFVRDLPVGNGALVACCKGIDRMTGLGPVASMEASRPGAMTAILTGPSFAVDIASGLPTALVLAARKESTAAYLQNALTRPTLRIYRTTDVAGAELGGALKNVVALAAGMAIGAGFGDSARASVISRGFAEMRRYALRKGANSDTIQGLSGLGDLVLTCTSEKSRNFTAGVAYGSGKRPDSSATVEGLATAGAVLRDGQLLGLDLPLIEAVSAVIDGRLDISTAIETLLARPVGKE